MTYQELQDAKTHNRSVVAQGMLGKVNGIGHKTTYVFFPATYTQGKVYGYLKEFPNEEIKEA